MNSFVEAQGTGGHIKAGWLADLSYLGLGVNPSTPTWGLILSDARGFFSFAWWLAVFHGVAIMITTLSVNFLGDGLRDFFDVREIRKEE